MTTTIDRRTLLATASAFAILPVTKVAAQAEPAVVQMLNTHPEDSKRKMVFYPRITVVEPGQTVKFEAGDRGHNSEALKDMVPEGTEMWKGKINEETEVTLETPGFYGYKCTPHASVGMVGLIVVKGEGMLDNLEAAMKVRQRGRAKKAWEEIWAEAEEMGLFEEQTA